MRDICRGVKEVCTYSWYNGGGRHQGRKTNIYSKNCKITLKVICDQIKITCSKSDLRSDQDHNLEHHKKVIANQIVISDHLIIRSLNFLNIRVWITYEFFKNFICDSDPCIQKIEWSDDRVIWDHDLIGDHFFVMLQIVILIWSKITF